MLVYKHNRGLFFSYEILLAKGGGGRAAPYVLEPRGEGLPP